MHDKPAKPATRRPSRRAPKKKHARPTHGEISKRAYFIHLKEPGSDEVGNWLRAERELTAA